MGKIRIKQLGDTEAEKTQKEKVETRRKSKKQKKLTKLKGKGGGRIVDLTQEEVITPETIVTEIEKESKKAPKSPKVKGYKFREKARLVEKGKPYPIAEAVQLVKQTSYSKFNGSVEVNINMKEKNLRGSVSLPHGTGREIKVAIASEDLIEKIESGKIDFDILVASPIMMPKLARVARILGPKNLMPNPKAGTISKDPEKLALSLTKGQTQWKTESNAPIVHMVIGKIDFKDKKLEENLQALISAIDPSKINSLYLKATMGPSIKVKVE